MAFVKTIQTYEAMAPLKELYQEIENTFGFVPNIFKSASNDYELTRWLWQGIKTIMVRESSIPRSLKEKIALVVSKNNSCSYCVEVHTMALKGIGFDSEKIEELTKDQQSSISDKEKAALDFALKITNESYKIYKKDHEVLKTQFGFTEQQILDVIAVASVFNFINRFVDALGTDLEA